MAYHIRSLRRAALWFNRSRRYDQLLLLNMVCSCPKIKINGYPAYFAEENRE